MSLRITAWPTDLSISQQLNIEIEITAEPGVTVQSPAYERTLRTDDGQFERAIRSSSVEPARTDQQGRIHRRFLFAIEFFVSGEHELPGVEISYIDARKQTQDPTSTTEEPVQEQTLHTDAILLTVSAAGGAALTPDELQTITRLDPIELPAVWRRWWWVAPILLGVALLAAFWLLSRQREKQSAALPPPPAHVWARRQLASLAADDLIAQGEIQPFYYRISAIVRGYIERRFDVSAPDMTTEEFLVATAADRRFPDDTTRQLQQFLTACDLVKYARQLPGVQESDGAIQSAYDFVEQTRLRDQPGALVHPPHQPDTERAA